MRPQRFSRRPRSLQRSLTWTLAVSILLAGLLAGVVSFVLAYRDAQELQDDMLRQVAALADPAYETLAPRTGSLTDPETRVMVIALAGAGRPSWLPEKAQPGFQTVNGPEGVWRAYVHESALGRIAVLQSTEVRDEIAMDGAVRTVVPLALLLPVLAWLSARIVRRELAPVRELAEALDRRPADQPFPVGASGVPQEIAPFAHAIDRLLERVGRLMDAQRRFVADAAHELRSPLAALSIQAQNVEQAATLEMAKERIAPLREGIDRAHRLAEQLLSLAASQAARVERVEVRVGSLARELLAEHFAQAEGRGIDLGMGPCEEGLAVLADPKLLRVILNNALDNALRYTPVGGEVTLRCFAEGGEAVVEIADTGPGIPATERQRVFEAFHRLEGSPGDGSGLGLAIARDAAARIGATVELSERPGGGLVFRCRHVFES